MQMAAAGVHDEDSKHALKTGLEMVLNAAQNSAEDVVKKKVSMGYTSAASRMLYELCRSDAERLEALRLISGVLTRGKRALEGCYPSDEAHWICAKAYNASTSHMRARDKHLAEAFMSVTVALCQCTDCTAVTADMCRDTAKKFSYQIG